MPLGFRSLGSGVLGGGSVEAAIVGGFQAAWFKYNKVIGNMKKNVSSQHIGTQMATAADGTAFTSTVTVYVTGDNGTQAIGSVGSGVCTHEGNGFHSYEPSQAETNYDFIAFTFIGSGAIPSTVELFTSFPQSVDNATNIAAILADTAEIGTAGAGLTNIGTIATVTNLTNLPAAAATAAAQATAQADLDIITGATGVNLLTATQASIDAIEADTSTTIPAQITTAQNDLDIITGATGVNLLVATQASIDAIELDTGTTLPGLIDDLAIKKNNAFSNFEFLMVLTSDHVTPATGLTVTGQRSIDGGIFVSVAGVIAEVSNGIYQFDALAADTNGDLITWRFSSATADDTFVTFKTVA